MISVRFDEYIVVGIGHIDASSGKMVELGLTNKYPMHTHILQARPTTTPEIAPC